MIQTEPNFNSQRGAAQPSSTPQASNAVAAPPEMTRTRCPGCQKLFAVETETLNAMSRAGVIRAEFTCTGALCHEAFAIELPLPLHHSSLTVLPAVRLEMVPGARASRDAVAPSASRETSPSPLTEVSEPPREMPIAPAGRPSTTVPNVGQSAPLSVPLKEKNKSTSVEARSSNSLSRNTGSSPPAAAFVGERECPRCTAVNALTSSECVRCGIVFERIHDARIEEEVALGGTRELAAMWDRTLEDYEDRIRHDRFLNACRDAGALSYASRKYSQILLSVPQDDIARLMRNRIVAMISMRAESSRLPIRLNFRIPKINSMALFGGSILFFWGLVMPQLKNVMEIGLSLVLLAIGVRIALRARI